MNDAIRERAPAIMDAVAIRDFQESDEAILIAGRDEEFHRWLGEGNEHPRPSACIVVDGLIVGWVDYDTDREWLHPGEINVGYNVFREHRGNGYATRAVPLLLQSLAERTEYHTATLLINVRNGASLAVARRCGFSTAGDIDGRPYFKRAMDASSAMKPTR